MSRKPFPPPPSLIAPIRSLLGLTLVAKVAIWLVRLLNEIAPWPLRAVSTEMPGILVSLASVDGRHEQTPSY